ncbi:hypothetical protein POPTR_019G120766v4 [Populus trichocarpa]|uniref:Uncharacterized protein n=1 Tax=Populus trichocarpa TaxID=3694 RepID=A0ACC0RMD2_POPTR|nr:hypothetical protein POPTR_019G120766v4 [Populus trichocarpa]
MEWKSPPSIWSLGTLTGLRDRVRRLVAKKEGINTPNTFYLRLPLPPQTKPPQLSFSFLLPHRRSSPIAGHFPSIHQHKAAVSLHCLHTDPLSPSRPLTLLQPEPPLEPSLLSADHRSSLSRPTQLQQRDPRTTVLKEDHQRRPPLLPPAVAATAASPTGAEQSAFSLRWRLQIQPLLLHRDKRTPAAAPSFFPLSADPAVPQLHHQICHRQKEQPPGGSRLRSKVEEH